MKKLFLLFLPLMLTAAYAAIYVTNTPNSVEYSDTPSANASEVQMTPLNTVNTAAPAAAAPANAKSPTGSSAVAAGDNKPSTELTYKTFAIVNPKDGDTINNQPVIPVEMQVDPVMQPGDKIQLYLDGSPAGTPTATNYQELGLVERGTHTVYGEIINSAQTGIKRSNTITIYVHRNSTITNPSSPPPPAPPPPR